MLGINLNNVNDILKRAVCLYDKKTVDTAIERIAKEMNKELADKMPILLCVMNGAVIFMGQLVPRLTFPLQIDYVHASRYRGKMTGEQSLNWVAEPTIDMKDRSVVIIEDILDEGLTLAAVYDYCVKRKASEVYSAALIDKKHPRKPGGLKECDFVGLKTEDKFLVGYGLDYDGFLRNLPGIYAVES